MKVPLWLRRLIRPLIPDRVMARIRLHQHSMQVRHNVDLLVASDGDVRRWLAVTPDTYRVGKLSDHLGPQPEGIVFHGPESEATLAARVLADASASFVAAVTRPRLAGRRRTEPAIRAIACAVRPDAEAEVGGVPNGDLTGFHRRLVDAGHRVRVVVREEDRVESWRRDPIEQPTVVILAGVPLHDVGGGSRGAQLAVECLRSGFHVAYVSLFGTQESVDLGVRFVHPELEQFGWREFDPERFTGRATSPGFVLLEIPAPTFVPTVEALGGLGWKVVYDIVDRWSDPALGGDWYSASVERRMVADSHAVTASAPGLVDLAAEWGVSALLVPNAVNEEVFGGPHGPVPDDFPTGDGPVFGYHGSLYGDWFDWGALGAVAEAHPEARVVVIGDIPAGRPLLPPNVAFLGLKPQDALPEYLARFDVGLVPFELSETTHAVSPLKVFEYLACGVPVAAPPLRALEGIRGVHLADDLRDAVTLALDAEPPDPTDALRRHSWSRRLESVLQLVGVPIGEPGESPLRLVRPAVHHVRRDRRI